MPTLKQPPAHIPYAKAYPSGVLDVLLVGAITNEWQTEAFKNFVGGESVLGKLARKMLKMGPMEGRFAPTPQM